MTGTEYVVVGIVIAIASIVFAWGWIEIWGLKYS